jgi:hypothetical protein
MFDPTTAFVRASGAGSIRLSHLVDESGVQKGVVTAVGVESAKSEQTESRAAMQYAVLIFAVT